MKVTDEMVTTFTDAWEAADKKIGRGIAPKGTRTRAGLEAVFGMLEIAPRQPELDPAPWVSWGLRYYTRLNPAMYFEPRPGYSQNREDYA